MKTLTISLLSTLTLAASLHAGQTVKPNGWRPPYAYMQQSAESSWTHAPHDYGMDVWNQYADLFRETPFDGEWGQNSVSEFGAFPSQTDLSNTWGFSWNGALALTCILWQGFEGGQIFESDVVFNPAYTWTLNPSSIGSNTFYYPPVLMHELGHAWGLMITGETYDYDIPTVMHAIYNNVEQASYAIHATDAAFIRSNYQNITALPNATDMGAFSHYIKNGSLNNSYLNQSSFDLGETLTVYGITVENTGTQDLTNVKIQMYLAKGNKVTINDFRIGEWTWSSFPAGSYGTYDFSAVIPAYMPDGDYTVGMIVTGIDDNLTNSAANLQQKIHIQGTQAPTCQDDYLEENDDFTQAKTVYATTGQGYQALQVCSADSDWYQIWLEQGERLDANVFFSHAMGDVSLWMFDSGMNYLGGSTSSTDNESFTIPSAAVAGFYRLHVNANAGVENGYSMTLSVQPAPGGGNPGGGGQPSTFLAGDQLMGSIDAAGDVREVEFAGIKGMKLIVDPGSIQSGLKAKLTVLDPSGAAVDSVTFKSSSTDAESIKLKSSGTFTLRIEGKKGSTGAFELRTSRKLPKAAKKRTKTKKPDADGGKVEITLTALPGTSLDVPVTPKKGTPDTLTAELVRPDGSLVDISFHYDYDGLSLIDVMLDQPGQYTVRYLGFPLKSNKLVVTVDPTPPALGTSIVNL